MAIPAMPTESASLVVRCAWCGCNRDRSGAWVAAPQPAAPVSHGICPTCFGTQMASVSLRPERLVNR